MSQEGMKYVLVTGGVISGVGKGIIASSIGTILKSHGIRVTSIKIDPYINIDAGNFSPYEHGEVFVLDDGGEVDLDFGNYEQFMDITLSKDNNITTGKIYSQVIERERKGEYLGKTVQVVPHITDAIQDWVERVAKMPVDGENTPDVCIIELGGTIGDIEGPHFVEAFRQFQFKVKRENICFLHVSLVPEPQTTKEQKTKPTQASVRELRSLGISPDMIACRSISPLVQAARLKLSKFCHVEPEQVYSIHDVASVYYVPELLQTQGVDMFLIERLKLKPLEVPVKMDLVKSWTDLAKRQEQNQQKATIVLVGKYTGLSDSYASVIKALEHASLAMNHRLDLKYVDAADLEPTMLQENSEKYNTAWQQVKGANGMIIPGGFGKRGIEGKIAACKWARTENIPFLGVCLGLQCAVIEFARNELGWIGANSTEFNADTQHRMVIDMSEYNTGQMGGTMRLGKRKTIFKSEKSKLRKLYNDQEIIEERHRHRYEVNPEIVGSLEERGMKFVGLSEDGHRMEIMELDGHSYYIGVQYHPEYISRPLKPSPPYLGLLKAACSKPPAQGGERTGISPIVCEC